MNILDLETASQNTLHTNVMDTTDPLSANPWIDTRSIFTLCELVRANDLFATKVEAITQGISDRIFPIHS